MFPFGIETVNGSNFWRSPENPGAEGANTQRVESLRQKDGRCPKNQAIVFGSAVQHADGGGFGFSLWHFFFLNQTRETDLLQGKPVFLFCKLIADKRKKKGEWIINQRLRERKAYASSFFEKLSKNFEKSIDIGSNYIYISLLEYCGYSTRCYFF